MPTATTYLKSHKRADKRTALQSLKDRFDYGLNPEKLGAVSSYLRGVPDCVFEMPLPA